jgi:hypothetical protein
MSTVTELSVATNKGTYIVTGTFLDEDGNAVTPQTLNWSLTDDNGKVINNRSAVAVAVPSTSNSIVLTNNDINVTGGTKRVFTFDGTYNSATYGNGLILRGQATFEIGAWTEKST